jgi:hypothetical protein
MAERTHFGQDFGTRSGDNFSSRAMELQSVRMRVVPHGDAGSVAHVADAASLGESTATARSA